MSRSARVARSPRLDDRVVDQRRVAFRLGKLDQLGGVGELALDRARRRNRLVEPPALAHHVLRLLGIIPQAGILDLGIQLVEPLQRPVPVEETSEQRRRGIDLVDMGLRFGAHDLDLRKSNWGAG